MMAKKDDETEEVGGRPLKDDGTLNDRPWVQSLIKKLGSNNKMQSKLTFPLQPSQAKLRELDQFDNFGR